MHIALILSVVFTQAFAATTKHPHTGHTGHTGHHPHTGPTQPAVHEVLTFKFDAHSMMMLAMVGHNKCYVYTVSGTEATDVHTPHGLHTLEMKMITAIDDTSATYTTMTHEDLLAASKVLAHTCSNNKAHILKLN